MKKNLKKSLGKLNFVVLPDALLGQIMGGNQDVLPPNTVVVDGIVIEDINQV